jgi:hypothetical protein
MKAGLVLFSYLTMAGIAILLGGVSYQALVRGLHALFAHLLCTGIASVTDNTANLSMNTLGKFGIICKDLFPCLQRRHIASSAFARGLLRSLLFFFHGQLLEKLFIGVAGDAGTYYLCPRDWTDGVLRTAIGLMVSSVQPEAERRIRKSNPAANKNNLFISASFG